MFEESDAIVLGGGIFGLYAARCLLNRGASVLLLESDAQLFSRASFINQARVHLGYHYPRSLRTALHSAEFFHRFVHDYKSAIHSEFTKIYGISNRNSYSSATQFAEFCEHLQLPALRIRPELYFRDGAVEACYKTAEYVFDAPTILNSISKEVVGRPGFELGLMDRVVTCEKDQTHFYLTTLRKRRLKTKLIVNATYAGINQVLLLFGAKPLPLKYELTELAIGRVSPAFHNVGITVMDGPFFSVIPHGFSERHSLSSVEHTPHLSSTEPAPRFPCQSEENSCSPQYLKNCNSCPDQPRSAFTLMYQLAKKYLNEEFSFQHERSLFTVKTILSASEVDDSRPTCVHISSETPRIVSVLSGKINTIYELDAVLK